MGIDILLIDDNPTNLELMSYLLCAFGFTVRTALSGAEGIDMACQAAPDLIMCDVLMPGMDGYTVVRQLRTQPALAGVPVIAVTALAMVDDRTKALESGFDGYISKPINPETFVGEIAAFLPD
jgi:CheY-like chemotaxis protein